MNKTHSTSFRLRGSNPWKQTFGAAFLASLLSSNVFAAAPANDHLANATPIPGQLPVTVEGSNVDATTQPGEPRHTEYSVAEDSKAPQKSVWWRWTSPITGPVVISTQGSGSEDPTAPGVTDPLVDTQVGVYTGGTTMGSLSLVARRDDSGGRYAYGWTYLTFNATAGTTYKIAVDGWEGANGRISLNLSAGGNGGTTPPPPPPPTGRQLTINIVPAGAGTVTASPEPGENGYANGTVVTLTANPADGKFSGWTGATNSAAQTVTVVMNGNKAVNAIFNADTVLYGSLKDHRLTAWLFNQTNFSGKIMIRNGVKVPGWRIAGAGDFNGDSKKDIVLQHASGRLAIWYMDDALFLSNAPLRSIAKPWKARAVGDFNADGSPDVAFQHDNGRVSIWTLQGTNFVNSRLVRNGQIFPGWLLVGAGDVDGDGTDDLVLKHKNGRLNAWRLTDGNFVKQTVLLSGRIVPNAWRVVGLTDVNKDNNVDLVLQHTNGRLSAWFMDQTAFSGSAAMRRQTAPNATLMSAN